MIGIKLLKINLALLGFYFLLNGAFSCKKKHGGDTSEYPMEVFQVDPLQKVFHTITGELADTPDTVRVARGESATFQLVVRSHVDVSSVHVAVHNTDSVKAPLAPPEVGIITYVGVGNPVQGLAFVNKLTSPDGTFPDPVKTNQAFDLAPGKQQPVWVTIPVGRDAQAGIYHLEADVTATINGQAEKVSKPLCMKVYPVTVPAPSLLFSDWIFPIPGCLAYLNNGVAPEAFSQRYWELTELLAHKASEYGVNVMMTSLIRFGNIGVSLEGTTYHFDFTNYDRLVELYGKWGTLKGIEGEHLGARMGDWNSDYGVYVPVIKDGAVSIRLLPLSDPGTRNFLDQFIPALVTHLRRKGWESIYMQHIGDEPHVANLASYKAIADYVKNLAPGLKIIDACSEQGLAGVPDTWVPLLQYLNQDLDFYQRRQQLGDELWYYTSNITTGAYANCFIEQPLLAARLIPWISYRYSVTGYLHWAFAAWDMRNGNSVYDETSRLDPNGVLYPGGDMYIVYPAFNKVYPSIRLEAMRDGLTDYELLKLLDKKNPSLAQSVSQNIVEGANNYNWNISAFRSTRRQVLEALSN